MTAQTRIEIRRYGEWIPGRIIPRGIAEDAIDIDLDRPDKMGATKVWTYVDSPYWRRDVRPHRFAVTACSQCGRDFGPGNFGFSHCSDHASA